MASLTSTVALLLLAVAVVSTTAAIKFNKLADEKAALAGNLKGALDEAERNMEFARRQERQANDNRQLATAEQKRAEGNLDLAMQSLNDVYLQAIGWNRLLGDTDPLTGKQKSTPQKKILKSGLKFYVQLANQNENSSRRIFEIASAFVQLGMLQANLDDDEAAQKSFAEAITRLENLTKQHPDGARVFRRLGTAYYACSNLSRWWPNAREELVKAERALTAAIKLDPEDAESFHHRGRAYDRLQQPKNAIDDFAQAIDLDPDSAVRHAEFADYLDLVLDLNLRDRMRALKHARRRLSLPQRMPSTVQHSAASTGRLWETVC